VKGGGPESLQAVCFFFCFLFMRSVLLGEQDCSWDAVRCGWATVRGLGKGAGF